MQISKLLSARSLAASVYVCLICLPLKLFSSSTTDNLWKQSLEQFNNNQPTEACQSLKTWVAQQAKQNIQSAEAQFNLGICSWEIKQPADSVLCFMESLKLQSSASKRWTNIKLLQNIQSELGIRENIPSRTSFILRMLLPNNVSLISGLIGAWILIFLIIFKIHKTPKAWVCYFSIGTFWLFGLFVFFLHSSEGSLGVISGSEDKPVITFNNQGKPEELTKLPPGTLIEYGNSRQDYFQIMKPIAGWIKSDSLQTGNSAD